MCCLFLSSSQIEIHADQIRDLHRHNFQWILHGILKEGEERELGTYYINDPRSAALLPIPPTPPAVVELLPFSFPSLPLCATPASLLFLFARLNETGY